MAKHRRRSQSTVRNTAAASAVALSTTAVLANPAQAVEVAIPGTDLSVDIAGIDSVQALANASGIEQWIPALNGQGSSADYSAVVNAPSSATAQVQTQAVGEQIVAAARTKIGAPYVWGAAGPSAFDCSGLTSWAYSQVGKSIPRTSYAQAAGGMQVSRDQLQPGDIIAFYSGASHVGIYTGNGTVIHALTQGTPLSETSIDYMPFHSAVRF
ncbi:C40 family peptidase [Corynebacterium kutscheri]|uniref:C40 family peptidase n=1 Tax=Corynebacterium kutscheri TaxID=35755 RepID=UPI0006232362|nr:C40 family peptidase [Corynebacterium kutscheri]